MFSSKVVGLLDTPRNGKKKNKMYNVRKHRMTLFYHTILIRYEFA